VDGDLVAAILGPGNGLQQYVMVLVMYGALFLLMRYGNARIEPEFRKTFWMLGVVWSVTTFVGNFLLFRAGVMSFLPWLNNFLHTFLWIGLGLGFLYAGTYRRPLWEQYLLFAIFSLLAKAFEFDFLHSWDFDHFFFLPGGHRIYILGWSLADGLYPVLSAIGLRIAARAVKGLVVPGDGQVA